MTTPFLMITILFTAACQLSAQHAQVSQSPSSCDEQQYTSLLELCEQQGVSCSELDQFVESIENECPELLEKSEADAAGLLKIDADASSGPTQQRKGYRYYKMFRFRMASLT